MARKHMKKCLPSLAINEMQIKTTLRFYLTSVRIATIKNTTSSKCWRGCRGKGNPHTLLVGMEASTTILETIWRLLKKLNIDLPCDPEIPFLRLYSKECDSFELLHRHLHTHVYCSTIHNSQVMETAKMLHY
jgi:hypothetical protein